MTDEELYDYHAYPFAMDAGSGYIIHLSGGVQRELR